VAQGHLLPNETTFLYSQLRGAASLLRGSAREATSRRNSEAAFLLVRSAWKASCVSRFARGEVSGGQRLVVVLKIPFTRLPFLIESRTDSLSWPRPPFPYIKNVVSRTTS
jgi:hypothetical protein